MAVRTLKRRLVRHPGALFVIPGPTTGLIIRGNLNLWARPVIRNANGSYSTVKSVSWRLEVNVDGKVRMLEVLMPEAIGTRVVGAKTALSHFQSTGQHLGMFDTAAHATQYANRLHLWFVANAKWFVPPPRRK